MRTVRVVVVLAIVGVLLVTAVALLTRPEAPAIAPTPTARPAADVVVMPLPSAVRVALADHAARRGIAGPLEYVETRDRPGGVQIYVVRGWATTSRGPVTVLVGVSYNRYSGQAGRCLEW